MNTNRAVGIDLGTTFSAVAYLSESGQSTMLRNNRGEMLTPSIVSFEDNEVVVGKDAKRVAVLDPDGVAECVKRDMGNESYSRPIHGEQLPPEVIQAYILKELKKDVTATVGNDFHVVITVPAYFDERRRKATADAGEMAGLTVLDIVNEPTAASLAFGEHLGYLSTTGAPQQQMKLLVYDLGGGTFDVTLIDLKQGDVRTLATDGDVCLGGRDWDQCLVDHVSTAFLSEHGIDPRADRGGYNRLYQTVEQAKHSLSVRGRTNIEVEHAGHNTTVSITREQFEELTEHLLERTASTMRQVLTEANSGWDDIDRVLLVGGSTRMPMVGRMIENVSGITSDHSVNADEAVARGAAIYAGYLLDQRGAGSTGSQFKVVDVNSHSLGIEGIDTNTDRRENIVLIPRNTALPARITHRFVTKIQSQQSIVIKVLEGESPNPEHCITIGKSVMRNLPGNLAKGHPVEVAYRYATNGRLDVRAWVPGTQNELTIEFERESTLSSDRISKWKHIVTSGAGYSDFERMLDEILATGGMVETEPQDQTSAAESPMEGPPARKSNGAQKSAARDPRKVANSPPTRKPVTDTRPGQPRADAAAVSEFDDAPYLAAEADGDVVVTMPDAGPATPFRSRSAIWKSNRSAWITVIGHVIASTAGLLIGYYILVKVVGLPLPWFWH